MPRGLALELAMMAALAFVAAGFRLYRLASLPPGLHHDEAVNGLDTIITIPLQHPIFFELNNGREPLFIYLQALSGVLFGPSAWTLRLTAGMIGILTVVAVYWLGRELYGRAVGVVASFALATSFWHIDLSRIGLRSIGAPLFLTLTIIFLWRGLRNRQLLSCALAGAALALDLYTYSSARVAVVIVVAIFAWEAIRQPRRVPRRIVELAVVGGAAMILFAPLGWYFLQHPDSLLHRADQVWIFNPNPKIEGKPVTFEENLANTLGMFFVRGDLDPRQNIPGRPVFDPTAAPWFVLGLALLVWQTVESLRPDLTPRPPSRVGKGAGGLGPAPGPWLLLWLGGMLSLGVLTYESPDFLRLSALAPAVFVTWALGLVAAGRGIVGRVGARRAGLAGLAVGVAVASLLGYEALRTGEDYFGVWAARPDVFEGFDGGLTVAARYVEAAPSGSRLFLYVDRSPDILFQSPRSRDGRWLQEYSSLLLLPRDAASSALYLFGGDGSMSKDPRRYFSGVQPSARSVDGAGNVGFTAFLVAPDQLRQWLSPVVPRQETVGGTNGPVELLGYTVDSSSARPGQTVALDVLWQARTDQTTVYAPYLHVRDAAGHTWGQDDLDGFAVNGWKAGDKFLSRFTWTVPVGTPPGSYQLEVGMSTRTVSIPPGLATPLGDPIQLGSIAVEGVSLLPHDSPSPAVQHPVDQPLAPGLTLVGTSILPTTVKAGDRPEIELLWRATAAPTNDVRLDLVLDVGHGQQVVAQSGPVASGTLPTSRWPVGMVLRDLRPLAIPGDAPTGSAHLRAVARDAGSGAQLGQADLGQIQIAALPRDFTLPHPEHPLSVSFGGTIELLGYDLSAASLGPGQTLHLTLYWRDQTPPGRDYTVFSHLLNSANQVVGQQDGQPARGASPTLGWVPGQVVKDEYDLKVDPSPSGSSLTLEVGLYDPTNGARLAVDNGDPDRRLILGKLPLVTGPSR